MQQARNLTLHYFIRAAILTGFAMYIIFLVKTDNILYYIAPRMVIYVKISAIGFYAIAVYQVYQGIGSLWGSRAACDCEHPPNKSVIRNSIAYSLFILPLLLGFFLPDAALGSALAAKKGVNLNSSRMLTSNSNPDQITATETAAPEQLKEMFKTDKYNEDFARLGMKLYKEDRIEVKEEGFIEILSAVDLFLHHFIGKKMEISGFIYREDNMKVNQFVVARFQLQCCSADAAPFGVMIESEDANAYAKDSWVKITGIIGKTTYNGNEIMKINAAKIEKTLPSKLPYVYPNYDFLVN